MRKLVCNVFLFSSIVLAGHASADTLPGGSYQQSCADCNLDGMTLACMCETGDGSIPSMTELSVSDWSACDDVSNQNGELVCAGAETCSGDPGDAAKQAYDWYNPVQKISSQGDAEVTFCYSMSIDHCSGEEYKLAATSVCDMTSGKYKPHNPSSTNAFYELSEENKEFDCFNHEPAC